MIECKLIFLEGIPGSAKSTTAQFISHNLSESNIPHKWWYEEEKGHPVYAYDNYESMIQVVDDLSNGNYREVISMALGRWEEFSISVQSSNETIIVDSCLFGYLTWSLFPNNVPNQEIIDYVLEVERIIRKCNPCLIYFYQNDVSEALKKICDRRSGNTESVYERNEEPISHQYLQRFVGKYTAESEVRIDCSLYYEDGKLIADGLPQVWARIPLIPRASNMFDIESLPLQVSFEEDKEGNIIRMHLSGSPLFDGPNVMQ